MVALKPWHLLVCLVVVLALVGVTVAVMRSNQRR
jgi:hypothetical protein